MKLNILAIGAHPDDVELCCAGTLLKHKSMGQATGIIHLTKGQLGTRGNEEQRMREAAEAARILGVDVHENLGFEDGFFKNDSFNQLKLISVLRKYRPDIVLSNALDDRHPDHGRAGWLVEEACFLSGLRKIETLEQGVPQEAWRPRAVFHYIQAYYHEPDIIVDISAFWDKKMEAIRAYRSQFYDPHSKEPETFISTPEFMEFIKARAIEYGQSVGAKYGEGFVSRRRLGVHSLSDLL
ncbi:MAG: bacillithiol biosynthesis deacetylase BshB1 [Chitinophagales bacterium]|nr:MAG: bacillithiol biosynthesis deacetylase BshB1 [Chitinophagales bacterium]